MMSQRAGSWEPASRRWIWRREVPRVAARAVMVMPLAFLRDLRVWIRASRAGVVDMGGCMRQ